MPFARRMSRVKPSAIMELERHGVAFDRDAAGRLALGLEAAHGRRRIVQRQGRKLKIRDLALLRSLLSEE